MESRILRLLAGDLFLRRLQFVLPLRRKTHFPGQAASRRGPRGRNPDSPHYSAVQLTDFRVIVLEDAAAGGRQTR
jgi:hypothetical protein